MKPEVETVELGRIERIHALRSQFGPTGPSTAALAALAAQTQAVRIPQGVEVLHDGEPTNLTYVVVEGELTATRRGALMGTFGPRNAVGILSALSGDSRGFSCIATRDTLALKLRADDMLEVFEDHFDALQTTLEGLATASIAARRSLRPSGGYDNVVAEDPEIPTEPLELVERMLTLRQTLAMHTHVDELAELARAAQEVHYRAGTPLWYEGERANLLLVLVSGAVQGSTHDGLSFRFGPGDVLGSLDTLAGVPRWYAAQAERNVIALALERDTILDLCEDQPELGFDFLRLSATMLLGLRERISTELVLPASTSS